MHSLAIASRLLQSLGLMSFNGSNEAGSLSSRANSPFSSLVSRENRPSSRLWMVSYNERLCLWLQSWKSFWTWLTWNWKLIYILQLLFGHPVDSVYARKRVWLRSRISRAVILVHKAFEKPSKVQWRVSVTSTSSSSQQHLRKQLSKNLSCILPFGRTPDWFTFLVAFNLEDGCVWQRSINQNQPKHALLISCLLKL